MKFVRISKTNIHILEQFLEVAGVSLKTFRYFANRPLSIIENHFCTWIIEDNGSPVAYGHLDRDEDVIWLGISVVERVKGKGFGKEMMRRLMECAEALGLQKVRLSVDKDNVSAIALYEKFGFKLLLNNASHNVYEWHRHLAERAVISSLAFMGQDIEQIIDICVKNEFFLEFSSGMPYRKDMEEKFLSAPVKKFAHNYFPAPKEPFVLNLGSANEEIRKRSIQHCINGMHLSYQVGAPFFSAHAGFCIDPDPKELGRKLSRANSIQRQVYMDIFLSSIKEILIETIALPTGFLIENNVLALMNLYEDGTNPLLCVEIEEMLQVLDQINDPRIGILLDTAHFKVSSHTLGFNKFEKVDRILPYCRCIHHSDNNGENDTNEAFDASYWFLPYMSKAMHAVHVIEVKKQSAQQLMTMEKLLFSNDYLK
jgi:GNAT superfamily N-acetyltransferase/endonuclease IV